MRITKWPITSKKTFDTLILISECTNENDKMLMIEISRKRSLTSFPRYSDIFFGKDKLIMTSSLINCLHLWIENKTRRPEVRSKRKRKARK